MTNKEVFKEIPPQLEELLHAIRIGRQIQISPQEYRELGRWPRTQIISEALMKIHRKLMNPQEKQAVLDLIDIHSYLNWYVVNDNDLYLQPIDQTNLPTWDQKHPFFMHVGLRKHAGVDNIEQLSKQGIFGDMYPNAPTYIQTYGAKVPTNHPFKAGHDLATTLIIDPSKLAELRPIYPDPEVLFSQITDDVPGQSFFVLGGLPAESIIGALSKQEEDTFYMV